MAGIGLQGAYGVAGANDALQQLLARRVAERMYADKMRQQDLENQRNASRDAMDVRRLDQNDQYRRDTLAEQQRQHDLQAQDRQTGLANTLADQIPEGTFLPPTEPAVGMLRTGGRGALLTEQQERPAVDVGPLLPGDTGAARQQGFIKTASAKQQQDAVANTLRAQAEERAAGSSEEAARHNRAMEARPTAGSTVIVRDYDPETGKTVTRVEPRQPGASYETNLQPTQQERNTKTQYGRARPVLKAISELSERINVNQGAMAKVIGAAERAKAQANLNDDVAEYESMISGFTPLIARALGHTGVLTEQDVRSVKAMFPKPGDSKSLRDRKVARIEELMGAIETGISRGGQQQSSPDAAALIKKYGGQ